MALPPPDKSAKAVIKPSEKGKTNDVNVKITKTIQMEYIAMAGNIYDLESEVNRLVFAAQAVRIIRKEYLAEILQMIMERKKVSVVITLALMNGDPTYYTTAQLAAIKKSIALIKAENNLMSIKDIRLCVFTQGVDAEVTPYINQGKDYLRSDYPIQRIDIFTHGKPGIITMGYDLSEKVKKAFLMNADTFKQWSPDAFMKSGVFHSLACRTGAPSDGGTTGKSLANEIANHLKIPVNCFIRRSDYKDTWGNSSDRNFHRFCIQSFSDRCKRLVSENRERNINKEKLEAVWMDNGAVYPVKSGDSPSKLKPGYHLFLPEKQGG